MKELFTVLGLVVSMVIDSSGQQVDSVQIRLHPIGCEKPNPDVLISTFGERVVVEYDENDLDKFVRIVKSLPTCSDDSTNATQEHFSIEVFYSDGQSETVKFLATENCDWSSKRGYLNYSPHLWKKVTKMVREKGTKKEFKQALKHRN